MEEENQLIYIENVKKTIPCTVVVVKGMFFLLNDLILHHIRKNECRNKAN
ncbi:hypothetical protein JQK62_21660 [Leptospira santarosai]|nr:hypothetical protein [Leptospira santarosai]